MTDASRNLATRTVWVVVVVCVVIPLLSLAALILGTVLRNEALFEAGAWCLLGEILLAPYLCLAALVAFVAAVRLRSPGAARFAAYGLLLNAMGLWLSLTPRVAG